MKFLDEIESENGSVKASPFKNNSK